MCPDRLNRQAQLFLLSLYSLFPFPAGRHTSGALLHAEALNCCKCLIVAIAAASTARFLNVQAVFGLIKRDALRRFHHFVGHFQAALGGQAMHKQRVLAGFLQQRFVHLIRSEKLCAFLRFGFLSHAGPHVGVNGMRGFHGLDRIVRDLDGGAEIARQFAQPARQWRLFGS